MIEKFEGVRYEAEGSGSSNVDEVAELWPGRFLLEGDEVLRTRGADDMHDVDALAVEGGRVDGDPFRGRDRRVRRSVEGERDRQTGRDVAEVHRT
ncbi:hypothetical protein WMF37_52445 [Sorangium sp. So ce291]|uniref:hypothetical protein n=1 Tax=Sorangium sp. So ce291 TaxID=3133294 RepID=UPI003F623941